MEILELKHIKGYLDTELKVLVLSDFRNVEVYKIGVLDTINASGVIVIYPETRGRKQGILTNLSNSKPILRPLSELVKEIEVNGEKFVPLIELANLSNIQNENWEINTFFTSRCSYKEGDLLYSFSINRTKKEIISFNTTLNGSFIQTNYPDKIIQKLYEWHFDIHGLIEKGLAIDKNTLHYQTLPPQ